MPEENGERKRDEDRPEAGEPAPRDDARTTPQADEGSDTDDEESLSRLGDWVTRELDRCANDAERLKEAAMPLGRIKIEPGEAIDAKAMNELDRTNHGGPLQIDSRVEAMDDDDNIPESEYFPMEETRVQVVEGKLGPREITKMLRGKWLIVQRDQLDAVAETIDKTGINSAQAIAIVMMLVGARIGERRMRDLIETMSQMTEVQTRGRQRSK